MRNIRNLIRYNTSKKRKKQNKKKIKRSEIKFSTAFFEIFQQGYFELWTNKNSTNKNATKPLFLTSKQKSRIQWTLQQKRHPWPTNSTRVKHKLQADNNDPWLINPNDEPTISSLERLKERNNQRHNWHSWIYVLFSGKVQLTSLF